MVDDGTETFKENNRLAKMEEQAELGWKLIQLQQVRKENQNIHDRITGLELEMQDAIKKELGGSAVKTILADKIQKEKEYKERIRDILRLEGEINMALQKLDLPELW